MKSISCLSLKQTGDCFCKDGPGFPKKVLDNVRTADKEYIWVCNLCQSPAAQQSLRGAVLSDDLCLAALCCPCKPVSEGRRFQRAHPSLLAATTC